MISKIFPDGIFSDLQLNLIFQNFLRLFGLVDISHNLEYYAQKTDFFDNLITFNKSKLI